VIRAGRKNRCCVMMEFSFLSSSLKVKVWLGLLFSS